MASTETPSLHLETRGAFSLRPFIVCAISFAAMWHVWRDIIAIGYRDAEASHIFLVPFVIAWLAWCRRGRIVGNTAGFGWPSVLLVVLGFITHQVGLTYSTIVLWHLSAVLVAAAGFGIAFGATNFRAMLAPVAALLFAIPVPGLVRQRLSLPLQYHSASLTKFVLQSLGIPIEQNGIVLSLNESFVTVAEACNGIRMLMALLLLVYAFGFSQRLSRAVRVGLLVASPLIVLLLNTVRIIVSVWAYVVLPEQFASSLHEVSGWLICIGILAGIFAFIGPTTDESSTPAKPSTPKSDSSSFPLPKAIGVVCLCGLLLFSIIICPTQPQLDGHHETLKQLFARVPFVIDDWVAKEEPLHPAEIGLLKPNAAFRRVYRHLNTDEEVTVFAVATRQARDLIGHEPSTCLVGQGWTNHGQKDVQWKVSQQPLNIRSFDFSWPKSTGHRLRVLSLLIRPDGVTTGDTQEIAAAASDYRLQPFGAAAIRLSNSASLSDQEWEQASQTLLSAFVPIVEHFQNSALAKKPNAF